MTQELSEYELTRAENIKRNEEFIKSLGIAPLVKKESKRSTSTSASKRRKSRQSDASNDNDDNDDYFYVKEEGADIDETNHFPIERKKSRRLQNMAPDYHTIDPNILLDLTNNADYDNNGSYDDLPLISITPRVPMTFDEEEDAERLPIDAEQVRQFIDSTNPAHKDIITNKVTKFKSSLHIIMFWIFIIFIGYISYRPSYELHVQQKAGTATADDFWVSLVISLHS